MKKYLTFLILGGLCKNICFCELTFRQILNHNLDDPVGVEGNTPPSTTPSFREIFKTGTIRPRVHPPITSAPSYRQILKTGTISPKKFNSVDDVLVDESAERRDTGDGDEDEEGSIFPAVDGFVSVPKDSGPIKRVDDPGYKPPPPKAFNYVPVITGGALGVTATAVIAGIYAGTPALIKYYNRHHNRGFVLYDNNLECVNIENDAPQNVVVDNGIRDDVHRDVPMNVVNPPKHPNPVRDRGDLEEVHKSTPNRRQEVNEARQKTPNNRSDSPNKTSNDRVDYSLSLPSAPNPSAPNPSPPNPSAPNLTPLQECKTPEALNFYASPTKHLNTNSLSRSEIQRRRTAISINNVYNQNLGWREEDYISPPTSYTRNLNPFSPTGTDPQKDVANNRPEPNRPENDSPERQEGPVLRGAESIARQNARNRAREEVTPTSNRAQETGGARPKEALIPNRNPDRNCRGNGSHIHTAECGDVSGRYVHRVNHRAEEMANVSVQKKVAILDKRRRVCKDWVIPEYHSEGEGEGEDDQDDRQKDPDWVPPRKNGGNRKNNKKK